MDMSVYTLIFGIIFLIIIWKVISMVRRMIFKVLGIISSILIIARLWSLIQTW